LISSRLKDRKSLAGNYEAQPGGGPGEQPQPGRPWVRSERLPPLLPKTPRLLCLPPPMPGGVVSAGGRWRATRANQWVVQRACGCGRYRRITYLELYLPGLKEGGHGGRFARKKKWCCDWCDFWGGGVLSSFTTGVVGPTMRRARTWPPRRRWSRGDGN